MKKKTNASTKNERSQIATGFKPSARTSLSTSRRTGSASQSLGARSTMCGHLSLLRDCIRPLQGLGSPRLRPGIRRNPYIRHYSVDTCLRTNGYTSLHYISRSISRENRVPRYGGPGTVKKEKGQASSKESMRRSALRILPMNSRETEEEEEEDGKEEETEGDGFDTDHREEDQASLVQQEPRTQRRSPRKLVLSSQQLQTSRQLMLEVLVKRGCQDGLEVVITKDKGRGVVTQQEFQKGQFVLECAGQLMSRKDGLRRERVYRRRRSAGCFMYFFTHDGKRYCIDATKDDGKLGRLVNHSRRGNCKAKLITVDQQPHLILVAARHLAKGEEITYDYGDKDPDVIKNNPWLKH